MDQQTAKHDALRAVQIEMESDAVARTLEAYRSRSSIKGLTATGPGRGLVTRSITTLIADIETWLEVNLDNKESRNSRTTARYMAQFDADELAFCTLRVVVNALPTAHQHGLPITSLAMQLTAMLETVDLTKRVKDSDSKTFLRYVRFAKRERKTHYKLALLKNRGEYLGVFQADRASFKFDHGDKLRIGLCLIHLAREATGMFDVVLQPSGLRRHTAYEVVPTVATMDWIASAEEFQALWAPRYLPMVVPPTPWTGLSGGGYLNTDGRVSQKLVTGRLAENISVEGKDVSKVLRAVNLIQSTPWRVNKRVLTVFQECHDSNIVVAGLPTYFQETEEPIKPEFLESKKARSDWTDEEVKAHLAFKRVMAMHRLGVSVRASVAIAAQSIRRVAEQVSTFDRIYFPHKLDWRGRAYPVPHHLNPQGSDLSKGLLMFADGVRLGSAGQRWLAIHLANCFGIDKVSFLERVKWVREHHSEIIADYEDPHRPNALWASAKDDPWQALAAIFEWVAALNHPEGPAEYISSLPVGIDGSCNGLQHFSALLRDYDGGVAVNLVPADEPADVYRIVADLVRKQVEFDLVNDDLAIREYAMFWMGIGITRTWTKRNTMTLPYGVTLRGMQDQLWKQVGGDKNADEFFKDAPTIDRGQCLAYLARANWAAISKTVTSATQAMAWMKDCVGVVRDSKPEDAMIRWETPDGFPVTQGYVVQDVVRVYYLDQQLRAQIRKDSDKIDFKKQAAGISPNFIHSIDAAHMRATARRLADDWGITSFGMVHDSFATHAGNLDVLAAVTRDEFAEIHKENLLDKFLDELTERYKGLAFPAKPASGTLDLNAVRSSDYFFA